MAELDAKEQLFLELINRARMDPLGEAQRMGLADLNSGLTAGTISGAPVQVLAANTILQNSAQAHAQDMIDRDYFAHNSLGSNKTPGVRIAEAGYGAVGTFGWGENLAWTGSSGSYDANAAVYTQHRNLFLSAGHRANVLKGTYEEVGVGAVVGNYQGYNAMMSAMNYGYDVATDVYVTGVHYNDSDNNDFYSVGEGQGGRTVQIFSGSSLLGTSATAAAGGYGIELTTSGQVQVVFSGGNLTSAASVFVSLGSSNIKVDLVDNSTIETNVSATLGQNGAGLRLLGIENVQGTGNDLANTIVGNSGNNTLNGAGGNDTLIGGSGNDRLIGGLGNDDIRGDAGTDTVVFTGNLGDYVVAYSAAADIFTFLAPDGSIDTVRGIEYVEFNNGTFPSVTLQLSAAALQTVSVSAPVTSVSEGNLGAKTVSFVVTITGAVWTEQSVEYAITGSAANSGDVEGSLTGIVVFAPGQTSVTVTLQVRGDKVVEGNESLVLSLVNPTSHLAIVTGSATINVNNDDVAPILFMGTALANLISGTQGADEIFGLEGNDTLQANSGDDEIFGGAGDDNLNGGTGADLMVGGDGNDSYVVDTVLDIVDESTGTGSDTIQAGVSFSLTGNAQVLGDVENLTLNGYSAINGTGNALANILTGNSGNNTLTGLAGDDTLNGGAGSDIMIGGDGNDTLAGGSGYDTFHFENSSFGVDVITDFVDGQDKLSFLSSFADSVDDLIISGNGTNTVVVAVGDNSVTLHGASAITITNADLLFI